MVRIPAEYQEVEYLESTGTQYIDTGVYIANSQVNYRVVVDSIFVSINTNQSNILFGNGFTSGSWFGASTDGQLTLGGGIYFTESPFARSIKTAVFDGTKITATVGDETLSRTGSVAGNLHLLEYGNMYHSRARIYSEEVYESNVLVQHFIPCYRKSDSKPGMYDTVSKTFYTNSGTGEFLVGNNVYYDITNLLESRRRILLTTPHLESPTPANPLTFKSNMTTKLKEGKVYFTPVQEGTGDPSPDNVRPILGWDGITIEQANEYYRLIPEDVQAVTYNGLTREYVGNGKYRVHGTLTSRYTTNPIYFEPFTCPDADGRMLRFFNSAAVGSIIGVFSIKFYNGTELVEEWVFNEPNRVVQNYVSMAGKRIDNFKLFFGNTLVGEQLDFTFQPSFTTSLKTITIPFPQTIYGGYVDLVNGEVVEEWESFALDGEENNIREFNRGQSAHRFDFYLTNLHGSAKVASTEWLCNRMTYDSSSTALFGTFRMYNTTNLVIGNGDNMLADLAAFKQWLSENTPEFCAPLATPIHHTLTDGLTHLTLGESITGLPNGRSSTGGYANSTATGADGCKFIYFELGWPNSTPYLAYTADISRKDEFKIDGYTLRSDLTSWGTGSASKMNLGDYMVVEGSSVDIEEDPLVYVYMTVPTDCTDLASKRAYLAEHPVELTYPKKTPMPYYIDQNDLRPNKGTNNIWSDANGNIEISFYKH